MTDSGMVGGKVYNIGYRGIQFTYSGVRSTLTPSGCVFRYVEFTSIGEVNPAPIPWALALSDQHSDACVGVEIDSCNFHDLVSWGAKVQGMLHRLHHCTFDGVCSSIGDASAIYAGRTWLGCGTKIDHNTISNVIRLARIPTSYGLWGVYLDDLQSGVEVSDNVLSDCDNGILVNGGRYCTVTRNELTRCANGHHESLMLGSWWWVYPPTTSDDDLATISSSLSLPVWDDYPWVRELVPGGDDYATRTYPKAVVMTENWVDSSVSPYMAKILFAHPEAVFDRHQLNYEIGGESLVTLCSMSRIDYNMDWSLFAGDPCTYP
jgi:parallel beta-helix repeat protein